MGSKVPLDDNPNTAIIAATITTHNSKQFIGGHRRKFAKGWWAQGLLISKSAGKTSTFNNIAIKPLNLLTQTTKVANERIRY